MNIKTQNNNDYEVKQMRLEEDNTYGKGTSGKEPQNKNNQIKRIKLMIIHEVQKSLTKPFRQNMLVFTIINRKYFN